MTLTWLNWAGHVQSCPPHFCQMGFQRLMQIPWVFGGKTWSVRREACPFNSHDCLVTCRICLYNFLSVLWHCWLDIGNSIRPVKNAWWSAAGHWCGYLSEARCKWLAYSSADGTATPSSLASLKSRMVFTFLVPAYPSCPEKRPSICMSVFPLLSSSPVGWDGKPLPTAIAYSTSFIALPTFLTWLRLWKQSFWHTLCVRAYNDTTGGQGFNFKGQLRGDQLFTLTT